ncbi:hypothetical protein C1646_753612, partial [Rhizophagus diaphanus]
FEEFLTENDINYDDQSGYFKIYSSIAVKSTDIVRTAASFYGNEWFQLESLQENLEGIWISTEKELLER